MDRIISELELEARRMINAARDTVHADTTNHDTFSTQQAVLNTFVAMWSASLSRHRVCCIAVALSNMTLPQEEINKALTHFVRLKLLRTVVHGGERHYEINFVREA